MLYYAGTALFVVRASFFRASAFFHIGTRHLILLLYLTSMQSPQQSGTQMPHPVHFSSSISIREPSGSSSSSIHEIAFSGHSLRGLHIRLSDEHFLLSMYAFTVSPPTSFAHNRRCMVLFLLIRRRYRKTIYISCIRGIT